MRLVMICPGDSGHTTPWVEAFVGAGHEVLIYAYPPVTEPFEGATVIPVPTGGPLSRGRWILRRLHQDRPDVASLHYVNVDSWALVRFARVPVVLSVWGSDILLELPASRMKRWLVGAALRGAQMVVSPAAHVTKRLEAMGVRSSRVKTAQYGIDTAAFRPIRADVAEPPVTVVCTRSFSSVYGIEDIVRAAALVSAGDVAEFVFVGGGPLLPEIKALAGSLGVTDRCRFLGPVERAELPSLLARADVYCSMSRSDGTSLSLLEAMATGLTPVLSDIEANREWIDDGIDGAIVPPGDPDALAAALARVARDSDMRRRSRDAVRSKVVQRADLTHNMRGIVEAVERLAPDA